MISRFGGGLAALRWFAKSGGHRVANQVTAMRPWLPTLCGGYPGGDRRLAIPRPPVGQGPEGDPALCGLPRTRRSAGSQTGTLWVRPHSCRRLRCLAPVIRGRYPGRASGRRASRGGESAASVGGRFHAVTQPPAGAPRSNCKLSSGRRSLSGIVCPKLQVSKWRHRLISWEIPRLCRGGSRSLTYLGVCRSCAVGRNRPDQQRAARGTGF